jgi:hypothetical protein
LNASRAGSYRREGLWRGSRSTSSCLIYLLHTCLAFVGHSAVILVYS